VDIKTLIPVIRQRKIENAILNVKKYSTVDISVDLNVLFLAI